MVVVAVVVVTVNVVSGGVITSHTHTTATHAAQMLSMAEVVLQNLNKAADLTCANNNNNSELDAVLSHALASAQELIKHLHRGN